jgi:hypothetical protein
VFQELIQSSDGKHHDRGDKVGAFQSFERGREAAVSCACHWTVGVAASQGKGRLYADVYSIAPSDVFVAANSPIRRPEDLVGVPISVGYQSGSHHSTIQALEQYLPTDKRDVEMDRRASHLCRRQGGSRQIRGLCHHRGRVNVAPAFACLQRQASRSAWPGLQSGAGLPGHIFTVEAV